MIQSPQAFNLNPMLKKLQKSNDGFIAIVALGIVMLMSIFGIIIQSTTLDTVQSVKNTNNYYEARDTADSIVEYLTYTAKSVDAGFNLDEINCKYGKYADPKNKNSSKCKDIVNLLAKDTDDVEISFKIKGRNDSAEKFTGPCPGGLQKGCYVSPIASEGSAGDRCQLYTPDYKKTTALVNNSGQIIDGQKGEGISQIDYACNWNKLTFGSTATNRATIPFYYATADGIQNTYFGNPPGLFAVRLRTPCLPCVTDQKLLKKGQNRLCTANTDPTICKPTERYTLSTDEKDSTPDDIIVQWQFSGTCQFEGKEKECGLIPVTKRDSNGFVSQDASAISDSRINKEKSTSSVILIPKKHRGIDTNTYNLNGVAIMNALKTFKKPVFTLFLSDQLMSNQNQNVPYLEYQVLTERLVGAPSKQLEAKVVVNDNIFTKTIFLEESKDLIDFAIQN